jgi:hypothetical protein
MKQATIPHADLSMPGQSPTGLRKQTCYAPPLLVEARPMNQLT